MAFNLGFVKLCAGDIQHIYTTRNPKLPAKRRTRVYKPEFLVEQVNTMHRRELNRRYMEYVPKYNFELPRAPSFRTLSRDYVNTVVDRLTKPRNERFNFKYPVNDVYNDWRKVERDRREKLRDILDQMDGKPVEVVKKKKKKKRMKKTMEGEEEEEEEEEEDDDDDDDERDAEYETSDFEEEALPQIQ